VTRYLSVNDVITLYRRVMAQSGGLMGIRSFPALESAVMQPRATFDGTELYPSLIEKAAILGYMLIQNHPFVDGNKRIGHAAMEVFLLINGYEIQAGVDDQEQLILGVASGTIGKEPLTTWLETHTVQRTS
jgi:death-on-curing protein